MEVQCYECETQFELTNMFPACPNCGSNDVDIPEEE